MRTEQHPFTPEPREPEPWPPQHIPGSEYWFSCDGEPGESGGTRGETVVSNYDLKRVKKFEAKRRARWRERGFSIGFGTYT